MRTFAIVLLGLALLAGGARAETAAAKPSADAPLPMLDTGGHMVLIKSLAFTPDGRQLVSGSHDKTIRVWDLATGKTVRRIYGEAALGQVGMIYAIALSPDGKWLAAGGDIGDRDKHITYIRLYDFASGKLAALLKGGEGIVETLAFSPDGRYLISGSGNGTAIIWDVAARNSLHKLQGHEAGVSAVGFTPDGLHAVTGSSDNDLRLWGATDGKLLKIMKGHKDWVESLAISPDGRIASGDFAGEIRLWDGQTGAFLKTLARQNTSISGLRFSPDGKLLLSGTNSGSGNECHSYDTASGREVATYRGHGDTFVLATAVSPDGRWVATGGGVDRSIHIWDPRTGEPRQDSDGRPMILKGIGHAVWAVGFSADGRQIAWGNEEMGPLDQVLTLPAANGTLTGPQELEAGTAKAFRRAETGHGAWSLERNERRDGASNLDIKEGGKLRASVELDDNSYTYSFIPDGETIILGGPFGELAAYSRDGKKLGDFIGHEGQVWDVTFSADGRYLLSGSWDQTVRLWNLKTRELLVTLFRGKDGEWVMWTPQGFYTSSPAGARLIGWQINHGPEHEAEYVAAAQLRQHLNRPDIVAKAIQLASAEEAVRQAHGADFKLADLLAKPVPRLRILSPEAGAALKGGRAQVTVELEPTPDPVKLIRIQVNGVQIPLPKRDELYKPGSYSFDVPLAKGENKIAVAAVNDTGETVASVSVAHEGEGDLDKRGTLYILAIGVDKYPNLPGNDLRYAGADAKAFAEAMEKRAGQLHKQVVKRLLINGGGGRRCAHAPPTSWTRSICCAERAKTIR